MSRAQRGAKESTITRRERSFASVIERCTNPVRVTGEYWEFFDLHPLPGDWLNMEDLWGYAGRVRYRILRKAEYFASAVDADPCAISTAQRGKGCHHACSPNKWEAYKGISAKILPQWVRCRGF